MAPTRITNRYAHGYASREAISIWDGVDQGGPFLFEDDESDRLEVIETVGEDHCGDPIPNCKGAAFDEIKDSELWDETVKSWVLDDGSSPPTYWAERVEAWTAPEVMTLHQLETALGEAAGEVGCDLYDDDFFWVLDATRNVVVIRAAETGWPEKLINELEDKGWTIVE